MELVVFVIICYGISNILIFSSLFKKWREFWDRISPNFFGELFSCMICLPTWCGIAMSLLVFSPAMMYLNVTSIFFAAFLDGCLASGSVWVIHTLQEKLEKDG